MARVKLGMTKGEWMAWLDTLPPRYRELELELREKHHVGRADTKRMTRDQMAVDERRGER